MEAAYAESGGERMASCREIEKMVMPYINHQLDEVQLEQFLKHIKSCSSCREELEIYYTVSLGLRQLDSGSGVYADAAGVSDHYRAKARQRRCACLSFKTVL